MITERPCILIVTMAPLVPELGASQTSLNLAKALRSCGAVVELWSPHVCSGIPKWSGTFGEARNLLEKFLECKGSFDLIDAPSIMIRRSTRRSGFVIARSMQPVLQYFWAEWRASFGLSPKRLARSLIDCVRAGYLSAMTIIGWGFSDLILCLGSLEYGWMKKWFPFWRPKLDFYFNALDSKEREALSRIRYNRHRRDRDEGIRFLWIGRWAHHKGTEVLIEFMKNRLTTHLKDKFTIAGCGSDISSCLGPQISESGRVEVIPQYSRDGLLALLESHDAGLFTSIVEGWGLSLQEMLESGMPVYATEAGGVPDLRPFFKGLIMPFPPPAYIEWPEYSEDLKIYYETMNWDVLAKKYEGMTRLESFGR